MKIKIISVVFILTLLTAILSALSSVNAFRLLYGDVNSDGKVNGKDATLLLKSLADWNVEINDKTANCDANGIVNGKDATLLLKYLADWKVSLGADLAIVRDADDSIISSSINSFAVKMRKSENVKVITDDDEEEFNHEIIFGCENARFDITIEDNLPQCMYFIAKKNGNIYSDSVTLVSEFYDDGKLNSIPDGATYYYSSAKLLDNLTVNGKDISEFTIYADDSSYDAAIYLRKEIFRYSAKIVPVSKSDAASENAIVFSEISEDNKIDISVSGSKMTFAYSANMSAEKAVIAFVKYAMFSEEDKDFNDGALYHSDEYFVTYEDFGAKGDGKTDDYEAVRTAHDYANQNGYKVITKTNVTYYIKYVTQQTIIKTDTDWTKTTFTIDDRDPDAFGKNIDIFYVPSTKSSYNIEYTDKITAGQKQLNLTFDDDVLVMIYDYSKHIFIREGVHEDSGQTQTEMLLVHADGTIDESTEVLFDYDNVNITVFPIDKEQLTITGGTFDQLLAQKSHNEYIGRGIYVARSNAVLKNIKHYQHDEDSKYQNFYSGMFKIHYCYNTLMEDCVLSARLVGKHGSYGLHLEYAVGLIFRNNSEATDIYDAGRWGLICSNFCRNLVYENCTFSRIDAHCGICNITVRGCTLGHCGLSLIGFGTALIEDTSVNSSWFIALRDDYGATWDGKIIIRNCTWKTTSTKDIYIIRNARAYDHYFGYDCHLPELDIDGFYIDDSALPSQRIFVFYPISEEEAASEYAYILPEKAILKNVRRESGNKIQVALKQNVEDIEFIIEYKEQ